MTFQPSFEFAKVGYRCTFTFERMGKVVTLEPHRADSDGRLACDFLGPTCQIEVGAIELRLPEAAC